MNAKKFLEKMAAERKNEGLWEELGTAVNDSAHLNEEQQAFLFNTIVMMLAEARLTNSDITHVALFTIAGYINTCK